MKLKQLFVLAIAGISNFAYTQIETVAVTNLSDETVMVSDKESTPVQFVEVKTYPNPVVNRLTVEVQGGPYVWTLSNDRGVSLKNGRVFNKETISFSDLESGTYILKVVINGVIYSETIIKN